MFLEASDLEVQGLGVNANGGAGGSSPRTAGLAGANGRLIEESNTNLTLDANGNVTSLGSSVSNGVGTTQGAQLGHVPANELQSNIYTSSSTPNLVGLVGGAGPAGILNITPAQSQALIAKLGLNAGAGTDGVVAIVRVPAGTDIGLTGPVGQTNYTGYDLVLVVNLSSLNLTNPSFRTLATSSTISGGYNLTVGGVTGQSNVALNPGGVFATLVPTSFGTVAGTFTADGVSSGSFQLGTGAGQSSVAYEGQRGGQPHRHAAGI